MKRQTPFFALLLCASLLAAAVAQTPQPGGDKFVYADFEAMQDGRPVSSRGGFVQLISYQESTPSKMKGLANSNPAAPELVRLKPDDPNRAAAFDYELYSPNQYAGVGLQISGQADKDGKPVADDLSAYKYLSMDVYATGVPRLRVEIISRGQGINMSSGFPSSAIKVKPGLNTYKIPLNTLAQPTWADTKVGPKDVLKKLTAVSITAFCESCSPMKGMIVVDNVVFEK
ncbi:MAG TPA: hypothetical protein VGX48_14285 [Pyrinomonadaceae bacterium]|jgi:hypothetical protein|nr:hypothetical protein [Pyrinomonadaceae bacterium]